MTNIEIFETYALNNVFCNGCDGWRGIGKCHDIFLTDMPSTIFLLTELLV